MILLAVGLVALPPARANDEPTAAQAISDAGMDIEAGWLQFGGFGDVVAAAELDAFDLDEEYSLIYSQLTPGEIALIDGLWADYEEQMSFVSEQSAAATADLEQAEFLYDNAVSEFNMSQWADAYSSARAASEKAEQAYERMGNVWTALGNAQDVLEEIAFQLSLIGE